MYFIDPDGKIWDQWNGSGGMRASPILALDFKVGGLTGPLLVFADDGGTLYGKEVLWPRGDVNNIWDPNVNWNITLGTSIMSSPFLYHDKIYVGAQTEDGGVISCIGYLIEGAEGVINIVRQAVWGYPEDGKTAIRGRITGLVPDSIQVEFEGTITQAYVYDDGEWPQDDVGRWSAYVPCDEFEGFRMVTVQAIVGEQVVIEEVGRVLVLLEGWSSLEVYIDEPKSGSRIDSILITSGRIESNYSIEYIEIGIDNEVVHYEFPDDLEDWFVAIDISNLSDGEHILWVMAHDIFHEGSAIIKFRTGSEEEEVTPVKLSDIAFVIFFILLLVYFVRTKPARVSEDPSKR
jgi:hypothetical protein